MYISDIGDIGGVLKAGTHWCPKRPKGAKDHKDHKCPKRLNSPNNLMFVMILMLC